MGGVKKGRKSTQNLVFTRRGHHIVRRGHVSRQSRLLFKGLQQKEARGQSVSERGVMSGTGQSELAPAPPSDNCVCAGPGRAVLAAVAPADSRTRPRLPS